jgi:Sigma-70, region 4
MVALEEGPEKQHWTISQMLADPRPTPEKSVEQCQLQELVTTLIGGLPHSQRAALRLRCDNFSIRKAAEVLGVPVGTMKARLARGRAKLTGRFHRATTAITTRIVGPDSGARSKTHFGGRVDRGTNPITALRPQEVVKVGLARRDHS